MLRSSRKSLRSVVSSASLAFMLSACGGGGDPDPQPQPQPPINNPSFTVGGTVAGLNGTVTLQNNGGNALTIATNGAFNFSAAMTANSAYAVSVQTQPSNQTCTVANGSGTANAAVTNVAVSCSFNPGTAYTVGGTASGLSGSVVLQNNLGDNLTVSGNAFA